MKPVRIITATAMPLDRSDVDTDQIIPSDWLKRVERTGFEQGLFSEWREDPTFVLNDTRFTGARIIMAGPNFGTGSSREHAVWAIQQYGFDAVISPRFGDIFRNNATKNGLIPAQLSPRIAAKLMKAVIADPSTEITIDLEQLTVSCPAVKVKSEFPMDSSTQQRLLNGLDDIGITMTQTDAISDYESARNQWMPSMG